MENNKVPIDKKTLTWLMVKEDSKALNEEIRYEKQQRFLQAYWTNNCLATMACSPDTIVYSTYLYWMDRDWRFREAVEFLRECKKDWVEKKRDELIEAGNERAIFQFLESQARERGYGKINKDSPSNVQNNFFFQKINSEVNNENIQVRDVKQVVRDYQKLLGNTKRRCEIPVGRNRDGDGSVPADFVETV